VTALTTLVCGLAPAASFRTPGHANPALTGRGKGGGGEFLHGGWRSGIVVAEVAFRCVADWFRPDDAEPSCARHVDVGSILRLFVRAVPLPAKSVRKQRYRKQLLFQQGFDRVNGDSGVVSAAETTFTSALYMDLDDSVRLVGKLSRKTGIRALILCSEGYFETLGTPFARWAAGFRGAMSIPRACCGGEPGRSRASISTIEIRRGRTSD